MEHLLNQFHEQLKKVGDEKKTATATMKRLGKENPEFFDKLNELAEATKFEVRNYGGGQFYCWPIHELLGIVDPWPAARYPKAVLCLIFADVLENSQNH